jgi:hypothetical protein
MEGSEGPAAMAGGGRTFRHRSSVDVLVAVVVAVVARARRRVGGHWRTVRRFLSEVMVRGEIL